MSCFLGSTGECFPVREGEGMLFDRAWASLDQFPVWNGEDDLYWEKLPKELAVQDKIYTIKSYI